ncbi:30S ribosomal protein S4 [Opitutales bacterium]|jgi:small subunit ribosomal protein S4|nr:30S ribosomal protein S4 [Opitutales bacterium]MDG1173796.1 30S ribosomal protein S4 [Opitutales bacterium]
MSRYTGPTTRINRRFGMAIFPANKSFERRTYPPGQHGPNFRRKASDYGTGLMEKQKLRLMYGLTEKQFRNLFQKAKRKQGITGENFLSYLETRLDNVIYRLGFAKTRSSARQFVNHGHLLVNGQKVDIPSYQVSVGDELSVREKTSSRQVATRNLDGSQYNPTPPWLEVKADSLQGSVTRLPQPDELEQSINIQLVVEFYSR